MCAEAGGRRCDTPKRCAAPCQAACSAQARLEEEVGLDLAAPPACGRCCRSIRAGAARPRRTCARRGRSPNPATPATTREIAARPADREPAEEDVERRTRAPRAATRCCGTWRVRGASTRLAILDARPAARTGADVRRKRAQKKFTEPVALSSPEPVGFPLPRTAPRLGFDLLALRARCKGEVVGPARPCKVLPGREGRNLRQLHCATGRNSTLCSTLERARDHGFAEPVALSSTEPTDFPLPRTASRLGFDLLALRARRRSESTARPGCGFKPRAGEKGRSLRGRRAREGHGPNGQRRSATCSRLDITPLIVRARERARARASDGARGSGAGPGASIRSSRSAFASIWRTRSRVTPRSAPSSSSVCGGLPSSPKRRTTTCCSRGSSDSTAALSSSARAAVARRGVRRLGQHDPRSGRRTCSRRRRRASRATPGR